MSTDQTWPPAEPSRRDAIKAARAAIGDLIGGVVEVRITLVDNLDREIFTTYMYDVRPGQTITYRIPTPEDVELTE